MFEDEVDEVGSDVEAYCPKCKGDTTHVVISKYEDEIRRVQCNPCGDVHSFRKPRGEAEDDVPEPIAARKRALLKKPTWDEFFHKHGEKEAKPYEFREHYRENQIVFHPKFGKGFVSEIVSDSKVEITFQDGRRILVHNRKDIPGIPLAAEGDGTPTPPKDATRPAPKAKAPAPPAAAKPAKESPAKDAKPVKAEKVDKQHDKADKHEPAEKHGKADKHEPAEKHGKHERAEKHDKHERAEKHDKHDKHDKKDAKGEKAKPAAKPAAKPVAKVAAKGGAKAAPVAKKKAAARR